MQALKGRDRRVPLGGYLALSGLVRQRRYPTQGCALGCRILPLRGIVPVRRVSKRAKLVLLERRLRLARSYIFSTTLIPSSSSPLRMVRAVRSQRRRRLERISAASALRTGQCS